MLALGDESLALVVVGILVKVVEGRIAVLVAGAYAAHDGLVEAEGTHRGAYVVAFHLVEVVDDVTVLIVVVVGRLAQGLPHQSGPRHATVDAHALAQQHALMGMLDGTRRALVRLDEDVGLLSRMRGVVECSQVDGILYVVQWSFPALARLGYAAGVDVEHAAQHVLVLVSADVDMRGMAEAVAVAGIELWSVALLVVL